MQISNLYSCIFSLEIFAKPLQEILTFLLRFIATTFMGFHNMIEVVYDFSMKGSIKLKIFQKFKHITCAIFGG